MRPSFKNRVSPGLERLGETHEAYRDAVGVSDDLPGGQGEWGSRLQLDRFVSQPADPHLRTGEVRHDGDSSSRRAGGGAEVVDHPRMAVEIAVREIEPGDIHPCLDHPSMTAR